MTIIGTPTREPNTPGIAGYVLGALVSFVVVAFVMLVAGMSDGTSPAMIIYLPFASVMAAAYGAPVAVAGVIVVHLLCFRVPVQPVHVVVAAAAGGLLTLEYCDLMNLSDLGPSTAVVSIGAAIAAGCGRAAVVPLVRSRRRLAALGQLRGTARW